MFSTFQTEWAITLALNAIVNPLFRYTKTLTLALTYISERLSDILPAEAKQEMMKMLPKRDFEIAYRLDCRNLCAGFREDIEFHFSLSPTALMQKLLGAKGQVNLIEVSGHQTLANVGWCHYYNTQLYCRCSIFERLIYSKFELNNYVLRSTILLFLFLFTCIFFLKKMSFESK